MSQNILYSIDNHDISSNLLIIRGWAIDKRDGKNGELNYSILENGKEIEFEIKFVQRLDVVQFYHDQEINRNCGFNISFSYDKTKDYKLVISSRGEKETISLNMNKLKLRYLMKRIHFKDFIKMMRRDGFQAIRIKLSQFFMSPQEVYQEYFNSIQYSKNQLEQMKLEKFEYEPKISIIVPAYKTPENFLIEMIESVRQQTYTNWELCIADGSIECEHMDRILGQYAQIDNRIRFKKLDDNYGISGNTNKALELATGDVISLLDHDDLLAPEALYEVVRKFNEDLNIDVVYTDEVKVSMDGTKFFDPAYKPDFNLELLRSSNYICHFFNAKKEIVDQVGGFRSEYDGSQDYDFILRCCELANKIGHVDRAVYYWRAHINSTAENPESKLYCYVSGQKAVQDHLIRSNIQGEAYRKDNYGMYGVNYKLDGLPKVTMIVYNSTKNHNIHCAYSNLEVKYISGDSTKDIHEAILDADSNYVGILDANYKFYDEQSLEQMVARLQLNDCSIVGLKVENNDGRYLSCGRVVGVSRFVKDVLISESIASFGYMGRAISQQEVSALAPECVLFDKEVYEKINGLNTDYSIMYSLVDYCLRLAQNQFKVILDGRYSVEAKVQLSENRYNSKEAEKLQSQWNSIVDPYYNRNFSKNILYRFEIKKGA